MKRPIEILIATVVCLAFLEFVVLPYGGPNWVAALTATYGMQPGLFSPLAFFVLWVLCTRWAREDL